MENLPSEITSYILSLFPLVLRLQCREVCRTWRNLVPRVPKTGLLYGVSNDKEGEIQTEFYFSEQNNGKVSGTGTNHVDDDEQPSCFGTLTKYDHSLTLPSSSASETVMVGSCNGIVCYAGYTSSSRERTFYICNPVTGEQIQVPHIPRGRGYDQYPERAIGFGYDRSSNDYKVVRILEHKEDVMFQVYILGTDWTTWYIEGQKHILSHLSDVPSVGVFAGGSLHWIKQDSPKPKILAFDLEHRGLKLLPSVPSVNSDDTTHVRQLMDLGRNLSVLEVAQSKHVTVWELTKHEKKRRRSRNSSWVKSEWVFPWVSKYSIPWEEDYSWFDPSAQTMSDRRVLWYNVVLSCYDPETNTLRKLEDTLKKLKDDCKPSVYSTTTRATPHVNSLVSLKAVMEEGAGRKRKRIVTR